MLSNIMEDVVRENLEYVLAKYDCCKCAKCREDMIACALNMLPARYVQYQSGEAMSRFTLSRGQEKAEIITAIVKAVDQVSPNPRHGQR